MKKLCSCNDTPDYPSQVHSDVNGFTRFITFKPGYICTQPLHAPNSHGRHGMDLLFMLKGPVAAVEFIVYTDWMPDSRNSEVLPANLGYHIRTPQYEGQVARSYCKWLDGAPCYTDGSGLAADKLFKLFVSKGEEAMWAHLETYYKELVSR